MLVVMQATCSAGIEAQGCVFGAPAAVTTIDKYLCMGESDTPSSQSNSTSSSYTYIPFEGQPSTGGTITRIEFLSTTNGGTFTVVAFTKDGNDFTAQRTIYSGDPTTDADQYISLTTGFTSSTLNNNEYIGFYYPTSFVDRNDTASSGEGYYSYNGDGTSGENTFGAPANTRDIQFKVTYLG